MEDPKCNEYITMEELEGAIYNLKKNLHQDQIFSSVIFSSMEEQKLKENYWTLLINLGKKEYYLWNGVEPM